jgi:hypothetical protein
VRFLADENFPRTGLAALRERGYDVFSIAESDPGLSDELVAAICDREERNYLPSTRISGVSFPARSVVWVFCCLTASHAGAGLIGGRYSFARRDGNSDRRVVLCCRT